MRRCFHLMNVMLAVSALCACTRGSYAWEPIQSALAPYSEGLSVTLAVCSTRDKISNDSFVLGVRFGEDDDSLTSNDLFRELSEHLLTQRHKIEHVSSASGMQPEGYYYMGISGAVFLTADHPLWGRSAGEDLSDLFELYAYSRTRSTATRGLLLLSFPEYNQQLYVSNETIASGTSCSLQDILKEGFAVAMTEYYFKPKISIDTNAEHITFTLWVPILGKTVITKGVEDNVPSVIEVNDKRMSLNTSASAILGDDCAALECYVLPEGRPLFRQVK